MSKINSVFTRKVLKAKFESITREYSLVVIEATEEGYQYPEASDNIRFLNEFLFDISCSIEDHKKTVKA